MLVSVIFSTFSLSRRQSTRIDQTVVCAPGRRQYVTVTDRFKFLNQFNRLQAIRGRFYLLN